MTYIIKLPPATINNIKQGKPFEGMQIYDALVRKGGLNDPKALLKKEDRATLLKLYSAHLSLTVEQEDIINLSRKEYISAAELNMRNQVNLKADGYSNARIGSYIKTAAQGQHKQNTDGIEDAFVIVAAANAIADQFEHFNVAQSLADLYTRGKVGDFPLN
ncbi:MAG: hypothetical protein WCT52_02810 [Candidatus Micrarchaeia archaeon]